MPTPRTRAVLHRYSAEKQIFIGFDTICFSGVTYESPAFREARIRRRDAFLAEPPAQVARDVEAARVEAENFYEFTLGVYMQNPRFDDLGLPGSIWRLALVTPVGQVAPTLIKRVGHADVNTRAYYPYMGDFWTMYQVRFPKVVQARARGAARGGDFHRAARLLAREGGVPAANSVDAQKQHLGALAGTVEGPLAVRAVRVKPGALRRGLGDSGQRQRRGMLRPGVKGGVAGGGE